MFNYCESLTLAIRHPRTWGRLVHLRSSAFMRRQVRDRELRRKVWPDYTFGCKRVLFSSRYLPALQQSNVELVTDRDRPADRGRGRDRRTATTRSTASSTARASRRNDFMFPMAVAGAGGRDLRDTWAERRARASRHHRPGLPVDVRALRARTRTPPAARSSSTTRPRPPTCARRSRPCGRAAPPRSRCGRRSRRPATASCRRASPGRRGRRATPGTRTTDGRIVTNWPGYMREYAAATRTLDASQFTFHGAR